MARFVSCKWAPYKLNNGGIEGTVDLTIRNDYDDVSKKIIEVKKWMYPSWVQKGGVKIISYKISKKKIKIISKEPFESNIYSTTQQKMIHRILYG